MRVVGGRLRGRPLAAPKSRTIRPTSDRLREAIFNVLLHSYGDPATGGRVADVFAGTGALGIEALSRGAASAFFIDEAAEALALLRANIDRLGLAQFAGVERRNATRLGARPPQRQPFTLVFLDPPYGRGLAPVALESLRDGDWLAAGALCVIEENSDAAIRAPASFEPCEQRFYGDAQAAFLRFRGR